jgi:hypothetical protein
MILISTYLVGMLVLLGVVLFFMLRTKTDTLTDLIGSLSGETCKEQTLEVLDAVLCNEVLFELVKEPDSKFSGFEYIDVFNINTSKFGKLVAKYNTLPTQVTSAERYLRTFKGDIHKYAKLEA